MSFSTPLMKIFFNWLTNHFLWSNHNLERHIMRVKIVNWFDRIFCDKSMAYLLPFKYNCVLSSVKYCVFNCFYNQKFYLIKMRLQYYS